MKKSLIYGALIFLCITNIIFVCTTILYKTKIDKQVFKVYSFEGENTDIRISNGLIIISPNKEILSGGKIQYIGNKQENIKSYSKNIYLNNQEKKNTILSNSALCENNNGTSFSNEFLLNNDIGEISSQKLFSEDDMNIIKDTLYFSLNYSTSDGQTGSYIVKLKVKELSMNATK